MYHKYLINDSHIGKQIKNTNIYSFREKKTLSLPSPNFTLDPLPSPFLVSTPLVITAGDTQCLWGGDGHCTAGYLSHSLLPTLLLLHHSLSFLLSVLFLHGLLFLHRCTCSNTGSPVGHSSFAVEHLLLLWPSASLWFLCLPSSHIFALS